MGHTSPTPGDMCPHFNENLATPYPPSDHPTPGHMSPTPWDIRPPFPDPRVLAIHPPDSANRRQPTPPPPSLSSPIRTPTSTSSAIAEETPGVGALGRRRVQPLHRPARPLSSADTTRPDRALPQRRRGRVSPLSGRVPGTDVPPQLRALSGPARRRVPLAPSGPLSHRDASKSPGQRDARPRRGGSATGRG